MIYPDRRRAKRGFRPGEPDGVHLDSQHDIGCSCQLQPPPRRARWKAARFAIKCCGELHPQLRAFDTQLCWQGDSKADNLYGL
jgi:hypothetical protein